MGVVVWGLAIMLGPLLSVGGWRWLALLLLVGLGTLAYGLFGQALGAFRLQEVRHSLRRA